MAHLSKENVSKLWIRMKSYINARLEAMDGIVEDAVANGIANAGHMEMELLWENASPTSDFAAQTVNINFSGYTHYFVEFALSNSYSTVIVPSAITPINKLAMGLYVWGDLSTVAHRRVTAITSTSITFAVAYYNKEINNNALIPTAIYGIKGVK